MKAVRFDEYGGLDVLYVADVPIPEPEQGEALVRVKAAAINPGEAGIREGRFHEMFPATFPSGEGSDLAGIVEKLGPGATGVKIGDEVIGWTDRRASHAEYVVVGAQHLAPKPVEVSWEAAGSLAVAGCTAFAAVQAVSPQPGDTVAVSAAAGGVGSIAVQLARRAGAQVIGIASNSKHDWLVEHGVNHVPYGEGLAGRLREMEIDAFIDNYGQGYVKMALDLGIPKERINTIADFAAARQYGVKSDGGQAVKSAAVLAELAGLIASGELEVPISATFPLSKVRAAFKQVEQGHTLGKIVLLP